MDQKNRDQQHDKRDQREMSQGRNRDLGKDRNEEETGEPIQLDKDGKDQHGGKPQQHQGGQPQKPESERMPDQARPAQR
jgi:hypothetical protein